MQLQQYFQYENEQYFFSRQQSSDFAKHIAHDFNPLHDIEARKFCVPGDLLFSLILFHAGLYQKMKIVFSDIVNDQSRIRVKDDQKGQLQLVDKRGKTCVTCDYQGEALRNDTRVNHFAHQYVRFSGTAFPHLLVPLMQEKQLMVNPQRPLVMYESMEVVLQQLDFTQIKLSLTESRFSVNGKRGQVALDFDLQTLEGEKMGHGCKFMLLGGLKPYDQQQVDAMVAEYEQRISHFCA